jgi:hypothetical protein
MRVAIPSITVLSAALLAALLGLASAACREEGPAERAGEAIDQAMEDVEEEAEKAKEEVEEALE